MSKATLIGRLPLHGDKVYCVDKVILLPLSQAPLPEELKLQEVMKYCGRVMLCYLYHLCRVMNKWNEFKLVYVCVRVCVWYNAHTSKLAGNIGILFAVHREN